MKNAKKLTDQLCKPVTGPLPTKLNTHLWSQLYYQIWKPLKYRTDDKLGTDVLSWLYGALGNQLDHHTRGLLKSKWIK